MFNPVDIMANSAILIAMKFSNPYDPDGIYQQIFANLIGGHYRMRGNYHISRPGGTQSHLLFFTVGGCGRVKSRSGETVLPPDVPGFFDPRIPQDYRTDSRAGYWNFYWIHFYPKESWRELLRWPEALPGFHQIPLSRFAAPARRRIRALMREIVRQARRTSPAGDALAMNLLENLFLRCRCVHPDEQRDDAFSETIRAHISRHLDRPITIASLAELVCLSPSRCAHRFTDAFGVTPRRYIENARLERAKRLLGSKVCATVKAAAYSVGFKNPLNFSKRFHARYGFPPSRLLEGNIEGEK